MKAAQSALLKFAHRVRDLAAHQEYHQTLADQLEQELIAADQERAGLVAAAWASLGTDAEREAFAARVEAIDPDFFVL